MSFQSSNEAHPQQYDFFDRLYNSSDDAKNALEQSKLAVFAEKIYPMIDVEPFTVLYSDTGRSPNTVRDLVMGLILQAEYAIPVDMLFEFMRLHIGFQYVFRTTGKGASLPFSRSNYYKFLERLDDYEKRTGIDLLKQTYNKINHTLGEEMGFNLKKRVEGVRVKARMDSMMIKSHAQRLNRVQIIYETNQQALFLIQKLVGSDLIPPALYHYFLPDDENRVCYHNKGEEKMDKLTGLLKESQSILSVMDEDEWKGFQEYQNLRRMFSEQCSVKEDGTVTPVSNKDIKGSSLQSPFDPNATSRTKNHENYVGDVANFVEVYDDNGNSLIFDYDSAQNIKADTSFTEDVIKAKDPEDAEMDIVTDGAYFSTDLSAAAAEKGINLIPTALTGKETPALCCEFTLDEAGRTIIACPAGHSPIEGSEHYNETTGEISAKFEKAHCENCPHRKDCPIHDQKKGNKVILTKEKMERAEVQASLNTEENKQVARERNGVEAIPSIMRRKYKVDFIRSFRPLVRKGRIGAATVCFNVQKFMKFEKSHQRHQGGSLPIFG